MARWRPYEGGHRLLKWQVEPGAWLPLGCRLASLQSQEWLWPKMLSWQEQARGPGKGKGAGCLPTRPGSIKGLGTCVPPTTAAPTHQPSQALDTPFPPSPSHLPLPSLVLQLRIHRRNQDCSKCGPPKGRDRGLSPQGACMPGPTRVTP